MGNFCTGCYPSRRDVKSRPASLQFPDLSVQQSPREERQEGSPRASVECHVQRSYSITRSETLSLLAQPTSSIKSEKKSLASKLSGTLNRTNSGKWISSVSLLLIPSCRVQVLLRGQDNRPVREVQGRGGGQCPLRRNRRVLYRSPAQTGRI